MRHKKSTDQISVGLVLLAVVVAPCVHAQQNLTAVWANDGGDKIARDELRATANPAAVHNTVWDGTAIHLFGAGNEVVAFNLVLEAATQTAHDVAVSFDSLSGPITITSQAASGDGVFDWTRRPIELFYVRYLEIRGVSVLPYEHYDERHVPERFRRPWTGDGEAVAGTTWSDRPDAGKHYPDIAVPLELVGTFDVAAGRSQSIWIDVFIPKTAPSGVYGGTVTIRQGGAVTHRIPVGLSVRDFTLPDVPSASTMLVMGYEDVNLRYLGIEYPGCGTPEAEASRWILDRHHLLAHRHRISLIDANGGACSWDEDRPRPEWLPRLAGTLFTAANGYDGPGVGVGSGVFSIGTYGSWEWQGEGQAAMWRHSDGWE
ncbi:MAG: hypothetical protein GY856_18020, partial [bacterium]|nr:hypothetical protein [bacterium]